MRALEDPPSEPIKMEQIKMSDSDEEPNREPIKMEQIKMSDSDNVPDRKRVNFVLALVEQETIISLNSEDFHHAVHVFCGE